MKNNVKNMVKIQSNVARREQGYIFRIEKYNVVESITEIEI